MAEGFAWPVRVYYEDTDAGGVVYYANYLKFMERARTEWLRQRGFEQQRLIEQDGVMFAVRRAELDYRRPARLDDLLTVSARIAASGSASLTFAQEVVRDADQSVCCRGRVKVACVDAVRLRPRRIPPQLIAELSHGV